jgi:hypothetical protein
LLATSKPGYLGWWILAIGFLFSLPNTVERGGFSDGSLVEVFLSLPIFVLCLAHRIKIYSDRVVSSYFGFIALREVYFQDISKIDLLAFYGDPIILDLNIQIFSKSSPGYFVGAGFAVTRNGRELIRLLVQQARSIQPEVRIHPLILSRYKL